MNPVVSLEPNGASYELEIEISVAREKVWSALIDDTNAWWLPDFHMVAPDSTVTFDARAGGGIIEHSDQGGSLLWYTVHWIRSHQYTIYLVGHSAPDWGGPATSHLKICLEETDAGTTLFKLSDAQHGCFDENNVKNLHDGWTQLFTDGLKAFAESGIRQNK